MYIRGVGRLQLSLRLLPSESYFVFSEYEKWARTLFVFDRLTQKATDPVLIPSHFKFDLQCSQLVPFKHSLLVFKHTASAVETYKVELSRFGPTSATKLPNLNIDRVEGSYSIAKYHDKRVYLTGGENSKHVISRLVYYFDLLNFVWRKAPELILVRT